MFNNKEVKMNIQREQREIKFRAWDQKNKIMVFDVDEIFVNGSGTVYNMCHERYDTPNVQIEWSQANFIILQYTGLKDKNGKEIYDGDILGTADTYDVLVIYSVENGKWCGEYLNKDKRVLMPCDINDSVKDTSFIIGNIYENLSLIHI